ncbi:hypothetical protein ACIRFH_15610 [Streptomyces sp. NPDC093586]|uniref:hypothetical protein n=1 Tax=Streptomyces sp. NPDC093586 TaxID=3366042 RepID=UPI0037F464B8
MSDTQLTVTLSGGGIDDARAVVRALEGAFGAPDELPTDEGATVRTATFSSPPSPEADPASPEAGAGLSAPVSVTLQGTPQAVEAASRTLTGAFSARDEGTSSGDQEQERQLLLAP